MALELQLATGYVKAAPGARTLARGDHSGALVTQDAHARYQEAVLQGRVFSGATASSGVAPGTAVGATAAFALYNPPSSGVQLVIWKLSVGYVSGTLGAGTIIGVSNTNTQGAAVTGTAITIVNALLGGGVGSARGLPFTTATVPTTGQNNLRPLWNMGAALASTALGISAAESALEIAGEFIVGPGATFSLQGVAAGGSSPLVIFGCTWEELPAAAAP
jgi:hypothetical protein